jgi:hypothetical protein
MGSVLCRAACCAPQRASVTRREQYVEMEVISIFSCDSGALAFTERPKLLWVSQSRRALFQGFRALKCILFQADRLEVTLHLPNA